ncbi:MAG: flippase-like domain-containing protein [Candidatus Fermentibacteraceae bacterium]|nr:flippase-like domain-containing protein [Candidatus Fermentibacteraceae bacterium]
MKKHSVWKHLIPGVIIAGIALFLTYRKMDMVQLMSALGEMSWPILLLVLLPLSLSYVFRILRWRLLLSPIADVSMKDASGPLLTGFMVNALLPGRVGEILRALLLSRRTSVQRAASFATVVLARIFDGLTLAAMTLIVLAVLWTELDTAIRLGLIGAALLYLVILLMLISLRKWKEQAAGAISAPFRWVRLNSLSEKIEGLLVSFSHGLEVLKNWREIIQVALYSLCIWGMLALSVLPVFRAMHLEVLWYYPLLVLILAGLGMLIPTPAGTGTVHGALVLVLPGLVGISVENTRIFALLFHTTQFLPIILVGLIAAVREGVTTSQVSRIADEEPLEMK